MNRNDKRKNGCGKRKREVEINNITISINIESYDVIYFKTIGKRYLNVAASLDLRIVSVCEK